MNKSDFNDGLLGFLDASVTPFHATANMAAMFKNVGFIELKENQKWNLEYGKKYFVTRNDSSIIAFTYPKDRLDYLMVGTHSDSPTLKLKPEATIKEHGVVKFGVEPYGGMLLNSWFDRGLSIAGKINYLNKDMNIESSLVDIKKTVATIPSLAIHLDDKANKDKTINKQTDISPILTTNEDFEFEEFLRWQLDMVGIKDVADVLSSELSFYDTQKASFLGLRDDFITSSRIDNLISCYIGMIAICSIPESKPMIFIANDHEEVGSDTVAGANGSFLENTLRRIFTDYEDFVRAMRSSLLVSVDNAHAVHPNFSSKHEPNHQPHINKGVVIKINANQRYASSSTTIAKFIKSAKMLNEPYQNYVVRSDMGCGSTIGPISATKLGIDTIDVGVPTLAMHSIREICGSDDAHSLYKILVALNV
jgi:aspartyl aminopeptidase